MAIKHYEIEGELLTREDIARRAEPHGIKETTIRHRLEKGNRTWKNLLEPVAQAKLRARNKFDITVSRGRR